MKKIAALCLCLSSVAFSPAYAKATEESLDQIVATVNDEVVTTSELNHSLATVKMQIAQENAPTPSEAVLKKQVLDQLINKKLQLQIAKQSGVNVTESDLNHAVARIAEQNHLSVEELYQRLSYEGMSAADYRKEMRDQITLTKLQQQEVVSHIAVTPQEIDRFMHSHLWQSNNNAKEYHVNDILIPVSDTPSTAEIQAAHARADAVLAKLKSGQDFKAIAQAESGGAQALRGGDLGWRRLAELPTAFVDKVAHMNVQQVAGPIQTSNGFHIIHLAEVRASGNAQPTPSRKEVENLLLQRKFEEAVQNWVMKLRRQAVIAMNSEKPNANAIG